MNTCLKKFLMYLARCVIFIAFGIVLYFTIESHIKYYRTEVTIICVISYVIDVLWLWSYIKCCWCDPGYLENFYKKNNLLEAIEANSPQIPLALQYLPRCEKCNLPKPIRTHHCSICGKCVFRFDHHCPYIGNCVGLYNMRAFILMDTYAGIHLILLSLIYFLYRKSTISGIFCAIFGASFVCMGGNYFVTVITNTTTLESIQSRFMGQSKFCKTTYENFKEIFPSFISIFFPLMPNVSGFYWSGIDPNNFNAVPSYMQQNIQQQGNVNTNQNMPPQIFQDPQNPSSQNNEISNDHSSNEIPKENIQNSSIL